MPNTTIGRYDLYRALGRSAKDAAKLTGVSEEESLALENKNIGHATSMFSAAAQAMDDDSPYSPAQAALAMSLKGFDLGEFPEGVHNQKRQWWKPILESAMVIGDTLATPQQLIWQGLADAKGEGDWRKAIPDWAAPDEWKQQGIEHELIMVGDVLDEYIGGKYHAKLEELDKKGGASKYLAGYGLRAGEFITDIALDPMNVIVGAGIGKKLAKTLRHALPEAVQIEHGLKAAQKSGALVDYEDLRKIQLKHVENLEAQAIGNPTPELGTQLAKAHKALGDVEDEIAYLKARGIKAGDVDLMPTARTAKLDKPGPNATPEEKLAYKIQKEEEKFATHVLQFRDLDNETLLRRLVLGPDDTEVLSTAIERVVRGEDPNGIIVRGLMDIVSPTSTSLELAITGIGKNGTITRELAESLEAFGEVARIRGKGMETLAKIQQELRAATSELSDVTKPKVLMQELEPVQLATKAVDDITEEMAGLRKAILEGQETGTSLRKSLRQKVKEARVALKVASKPTATVADNVTAAVVEDVPATGNRTWYRGSELYKKLPKDRKNALVNLESAYDRARDALVKHRTKIGYYETKTKEILEDKTLVELNAKFKAATKNLNAAKKDYGIPVKTPKVEKSAKVVKSKGIVDEQAVAAAKQQLDEAEAALKGMDDPATAAGLNRARLKELQGKLAEAKVAVKEAKKPGAKVIDEDAVKAATEKVERLKAIQLEAKANVATATKELQHFKENGTFSKATQENLHIKLPSGPRRNIFSASDFVDTTKFGTRMAVAMLYPGSVMPSINSHLISRAFREPMRVLESHLPGAWEIVRGGQKAKEAFVKGTIGKLTRIYEEAGVIEKSGVPEFVTKQLKIDAPVKTRINTKRDELLYRLVDTDPTDGAYASYVAQADEKLLKAAKELQELNDEIAPRLGMAPGMRIEHYMHRAIKKEWFDSGNMPREFTGINRIEGIPAFMKERLGTGNYIVSATQSMDIYVRGVAKFLYTDPSLDMLQKLANSAAKADPTKRWLAGYATDLIANVKGDASVLSNALRTIGFSQLDTPARKAAAALGTLTHSAALTGNIRYPIMSLIQAINTTSAEYGMLRTLKGMARMCTPQGKYVAKAAGMAEQHMAHFEDIMSEWAKYASEVRILSPSISDTEFMIRGITFHTALDEHLTRMGIKRLGDITDQGVLRELVAKAARDSEDINHIFGVLGKPVAFGRFSRTGSSLATQFMSFPFKQTETIVSNSLKNPGFFVDYLLIAGQMQSIAGRANLDVSPFLGFGYGDMMKRDISSIPVDILSSGVRAFTSTFDYDMPSYDKQKLKEEFLKNAKMLIPLTRAYNNTLNTGKELATGEVRANVATLPLTYKGGDLQRKLNTSIAKNDPIYHGGSEFLSILTRVQSKQGRLKADADLQQRLNRGERKRLAESIVREGESYYRNGGKKPFDRNKVNKLMIELSRLGIPLSSIADIDKMMQKEENAHILIERLRDDPPELGDELRTFYEHPLYQGE